MTEGLHNWTVSCEDLSGLDYNPDDRRIYVDRTEPSFVLTYPDEEDVLTDHNVRFNFTVFDNLDSTLDCNFTLDGIVNNTSPLTATNGTPFDYPIFNLSDGLKKEPGIKINEGKTYFEDDGKTLQEKMKEMDKF